MPCFFARSFFMTFMSCCGTGVVERFHKISRCNFANREGLLSSWSCVIFFLSLNYTSWNTQKNHETTFMFELDRSHMDENTFIHKEGGEGGQVDDTFWPSSTLGSNERVWAMQPLCRNMGLSQDGAYSFGKINARKCKLNFMILQTDLAIDSLNFNGILNQVHYSDNQFNLNIQPIFNICFVNKVMIWYPISQLHKINFMNCIAVSHKERCIMYKNLLIAPTTTPKCPISVRYYLKLRAAIINFNRHHCFFFTNYSFVRWLHS